MKGDYSSPSAKAGRFLTHPNLSSLKPLAAAVKNKNRDEMNRGQISANGQSPSKSAMKEPFQPIGRYHHKEFPYYQILIDIAEKENELKIFGSINKPLRQLNIFRPLKWLVPLRTYTLRKLSRFGVL